MRPVLAALTLFLLGGLRALAVASGLVVVAYAIDVIAGSPLTSLSLLGPNPGLGVRFYGIGNELEALLGVLVVAGTGAALAGFWPRLTERRAAAAFLAVSLLSAIVFAAGRFGADVGAAIVLPVGGAVAAAAIAARRRRTALLVIAAPVAVLALIALADLVYRRQRPPDPLGARRRRARRSRRRRPATPAALRAQLRPPDRPLLPPPDRRARRARDLAARARCGEWLQPAPALRAGLIGALAATVIGTLANDSGALLLEIGTAYLLVFAAYAWCERSA